MSLWARATKSSYVRLAFMTALAAFLAYLVAEVVPYAAPVPAAITAVVATRVTFHHATKETLFQVIGALVGGAVALAIVSLIGSGAIVIFLLVLLSFAMARFMRIANPDESPFVAASLAVTVILVVGTHLTTELAVERFIGVAIGAAFALLASYAAAPTKDTRILAEQMKATQAKIGELLSQIAHELREDPTPGAMNLWYDRAVDLRNDVLGLAARFEDLRSNRRWDPRVSSSDIDRLAALLDANQIMSARVLSLTADLRGATRSGGSTLPPAALNPLADLITMAATNMASDDPTESLSRTAAHEALRGADMTSQLALIGGIVSHVNRIAQASVSAVPDDLDDTDHAGPT